MKPLPQTLPAAAREPAGAAPNNVADLDRWRVAAGPAEAGIVALHTPEGRDFPLGYAQLCFWFVYVALGDTANSLSRLMIDGAIDVRTMEKALNHMLQRHESLRASISDWNPLQRVLPFQPFDLAYLDGSALDEAELGALVGAVSHKMVDTPFDLARPPLLRAQLVRTGAASHVMLLCFPHIVADGGAVHLFEQQLMDTYRRLAQGDGRLPGRAQTLQIADFVAWERQRNAMHGERALQFWRGQLRGHPYARFPDALLERGALRHHDCYAAFPDDSFEKLGELARRHKATLQMCLIAVIGCAVHSVTAQARFTLNSVLESREENGTEGLMAALLRVMPVPLSFGADASFAQVLGEVRQRVLEAYEHKDCPWSVPVGVLAEQRWRHSPRLYTGLIRAAGWLFARLFRRARLYPRFLADFLFMEPFPPEAGWRARLRARPARAARGGIADPVINVNMLQSVFKRDGGAGGGVHAEQLKDPTRLLLSEATSSNWEEDSINFYIVDTGRERPSIRMVCSNLNAHGIEQLLAAVQTALRAASRAPHSALNHMDN
ncbi:condensation domain-containing protein [Janthinobacterium fluminis]|uniref:Condensation domain-containing protein n=1 Tax=Janthinobacterium fluminis TaxID=2987524 RepID=A0ABT5K016_9BURK|nr:condensation domain-containing protein [Janthinobacterium fluminis]MDC8758076.1 condensation domain-containing protein [Janthinobacterium fluminis]